MCLCVYEIVYKKKTKGSVVFTCKKRSCFFFLLLLFELCGREGGRCRMDFERIRWKEVVEKRWGTRLLCTLCSQHAPPMDGAWLSKVVVCVCVCV